MDVRPSLSALDQLIDIFDTHPIHQSIAGCYSDSPLQSLIKINQDIQEHNESIQPLIKSGAIPQIIKLLQVNSDYCVEMLLSGFLRESIQKLFTAIDAFPPRPKYERQLSLSPPPSKTLDHHHPEDIARKIQSIIAWFTIDDKIHQIASETMKRISCANLDQISCDIPHEMKDIISQTQTTTNIDTKLIKIFVNIADSLTTVAVAKLNGFDSDSEYNGKLVKIERFAVGNNKWKVKLVKERYCGKYLVVGTKNLIPALGEYVFYNACKEARTQARNGLLEMNIMDKLTSILENMNRKNTENDTEMNSLKWTISVFWYLHFKKEYDMIPNPPFPNHIHIPKAINLLNKIKLFKNEGIQKFWTKMIQGVFNWNGGDYTGILTEEITESLANIYSRDPIQALIKINQILKDNKIASIPEVIDSGIVPQILKLLQLNNKYHVEMLSSGILRRLKFDHVPSNTMTSNTMECMLSMIKFNQRQ